MTYPVIKAFGVGNASCKRIDNLSERIDRFNRESSAENLPISFVKIEDESDIDARAVVEYEDIVIIVAGAADCVLAEKTAAALASSDKKDSALRIGILIDGAGNAADDSAAAAFKRSLDGLTVFSEQEVRQGHVERLILALFVSLGGYGLISLDYVDFQQVLKKGPALEFTVGSANDCSEKRGEAAAEAAFQALSAKTPLDEIEGLIFYVLGDASLSLTDVSDAADCASRLCKDGTDILFGAGYLDGLEETFPDATTVVLIAIKGK